MSKISGWFKKHIDKLFHFGVNFVIALSAFWSWQFAVGACLGASFGKEYGDSKASGNYWSWGDIVSDMFGMAFGLGLVFIIKGVNPNA